MVDMINGKCLCGDVNIELKTTPKLFGACHCSMCTTWSGGPLIGIDLSSADVEIQNSGNINIFASSEWAERGFCQNCGTHLFYRLKQNNQYYLPIGLFKGLDGLKFESQIFIDEKPDCYNFSEETKNMTGAEVFAMFGGE